MPCLSHLSCENNTYISHMGCVRRHLIHPCFGTSSEMHKSMRTRIDEPKCYFWSPQQVSDWVGGKGMGRYSSLFQHYLINGRRLMTLGAQELFKLGVKDTSDALKLETFIKELTVHAHALDTDLNVLPYFHYQALSLGREPPLRYHRELPQFTDPFVTSTYKLLHISANDHVLRIKDSGPQDYYANSRT